MPRAVSTGAWGSISGHWLAQGADWAGEDAAEERVAVKQSVVHASRNAVPDPIGCIDEPQIPTAVQLPCPRLQPQASRVGTERGCVLGGRAMAALKALQVPVGILKAVAILLLQLLLACSL